MQRTNQIRGRCLAAGLLLSASLVGCGARIVFIFYSVGGTVHGLGAGLTLVITNNGGDATAITTPGAFVFPTRIAGGAAYDVAVLTQPAGESCSVGNGRGAANADITDVSIDCIPSSAGQGLSAPYGNAPGARERATWWIDRSGNVWLFGGSIELNGSWVHWNDLWRFDPETRQWTWVSGSDTPNAPGDYGPQGQPSVHSMPGARSGATAWTDAGGDLWLSGGDSSSAAGTPRGLHDLWRFNPGSGLWTWIDGPVMR